MATNRQEQQIVYSKYDQGTDHRKGKAVSDANRLRRLVNAYVNTGMAVQKRPGFTKFYELEPGTKGLYAGLGKLNTFYMEGEITHANPIFQANKLTNHVDAPQPIQKLWFADVFNGFIYLSVEYVDGSVKHHYVDGGTRKIPNPDYVPPAEGEEPPEEEDPDNPEYLTIEGVTEVVDANCPHSKPVIKTASKIFAVGKAGDVVRYSKTADPLDWTEPEDAGFLPTGLNARGSRIAHALGMYDKKLVVLMRDGAQVYDVDPDPTQMKLDTIVENVGTSYPESVATVSGDLYLLSDYGFRSIVTQQITQRLKDFDVGSPIDDIVAPYLKTTEAEPIAAFYYGTGQYMCSIGRTIFVFTVSQSSKITAWSWYTVSFDIEAVTEMEGKLYFRSGDTVYLLDDSAHTDDGETYLVEMQTAYLNFQRPGRRKRITMADLVKEGECQIAIAANSNLENHPDYKLKYVSVRADNTRGEGGIPIQSSGTEFSFHIRNETDKPFRFDELSIFFIDQGKA